MYISDIHDDELTSSVLKAPFIALIVTVMSVGVLREDTAPVQLDLDSLLHLPTRFIIHDPSQQMLLPHWLPTRDPLVPPRIQRMIPQVPLLKLP